MRVQICSDLHLEFWAPTPDLLRSHIRSLRQPDVDVLMLAGDIMNWTDGAALQVAVDEFQQLAPEVVWVPGNHEYYGTSPDRARLVVGSVKLRPDFHVATTSRLIHLAQRDVVAGTMWYSRRAVERAGWDADRGTKHYPPPLRGTKIFSDFHWIDDLTPWVYGMNVAFSNIARRYLHPDCIVVTHHLPLPASVPEQFRGENDNCFFVDNKSSIIRARGPALWIHGHTHTPCDYEVKGPKGATRVVANPCGYMTERDWELYALQPRVVEV